MAKKTEYQKFRSLMDRTEYELEQQKKAAKKMTAKEKKTADAAAATPVN